MVPRVELIKLSPTHFYSMPKQTLEQRIKDLQAKDAKVKHKEALKKQITTAREALKKLSGKK